MNPFGNQHPYSMNVGCQPGVSHHALGRQSKLVSSVNKHGAVLLSEKLLNTAETWFWWSVLQEMISLCKKVSIIGSTWEHEDLNLLRTQRTNER